MRKLLSFLIASCVLLMGYGCKSQRTLSACESLKYAPLSLFYTIYSPDRPQGYLIFTPSGKMTEKGICIWSPWYTNAELTGSWRKVNDTLFIDHAFGIKSTDSDTITSYELNDTMTRRYKIIGDGLYDITDWTDFNKAFMDEFGLHSDPFNYKYDPNPKYPEYRLLRVRK